MRRRSRPIKLLVQDVRASGYDLVVMGALGMGAVSNSQLGSVTERFVRRVATDTLVVRAIDPLRAREGAIVVGVDGSPRALYGLQAGVALGKALHRVVEAVAVFETGPGGAEEPYLEYCGKEGLWLLILGRTGIHSEGDGEETLGSTTGHLLRLAPANVLVVAGRWCAAEARSPPLARARMRSRPSLQSEETVWRR